MPPPYKYGDDEILCTAAPSNTHEWRYRGETLEALPMGITSGPALVSKHTYYCIYCLEERTIGTDTGPTAQELQHSSSNGGTIGPIDYDRLHRLRKERPDTGVIIWTDGSIGYVDS